jgi:AraC-like DNA-binding protein
VNGGRVSRSSRARIDDARDVLRLNGITVSSRRSFEAYRGLIQDIFDADRPDRRDTPFHADLKAKSIGALFLHSGTHGAACYTRTAADARRDKLDDIALMLVLKGEYLADLGDERRRCGPGSLVVLDRSRPLHLRTGDNLMVNLNIPRDALLARKVDLSAAHGRLLDGDGAHVLGDLLLSLSTRAVDETFADPILDFAATGLGRTGTVTRTETSLRLRAIEMIEDELGDPDLGVDSLVVRLATSRASLYRAFVGERGVMAYIRDRRLARARELLATGRAGRISSLGFDLGFSSAAHFSMAFSRRFGGSPRTFRGVAPGIARDNPLLGPNRMERWQSIVSDFSGRAALR